MVTFKATGFFNIGNYSGNPQSREVIFETRDDYYKHSSAIKLNWLWAILTISVLITTGLLIWRWTDKRTDRRIWHELIAMANPTEAVFDESIIKDLPEPTQRYFRYTIKPGTPLTMAVEIDMFGELGLGTLEKPNYNPMNARQVLVPPYGLLWDLKSGAISGSDCATPETSWTRFWLFNTIPIIRVGGGLDHHRSAFGRVVSEGAFWVPASLLPSQYVRWESVDQSTARAIVTYAGLEQIVEIVVAKNGQPTRIVIQRWSNENMDKKFCEQPFGGELFSFKDFGGYTLPTHVTGGNHIGTSAYFPFYKATVTDIRFPNTREQP